MHNSPIGDQALGDESAQTVGGILILPEVKVISVSGSSTLRVAVVNGWDDIAKLQWLHVRIIGKACVALTRAKLSPTNWPGKPFRSVLSHLVKENCIRMNYDFV